MNSNRAREDARITAILNEKAGVKIKSVFDLVNSPKHYPHAISVLLELLSSIGDRWIKEGAVRALSVREARGKADRVLIDEFKSISAANPELQSLKWAIGNALAVVATDSIADELLALAEDKRHGKAREMVVVALSKLRDPRAIDVLIDLLDDDEICGHAIVALAKLHARQAIPHLERFLNYPKQWVRKEAKKALDKLTSAR